MTRTFNTRMVFHTMGALLLIESVFMALALGVSLWYGEADTCVFLLSTIITLLAGVIGLLVGRRAESRMGEREGYVIVAMVWVVFSAFGLLPYYLSGQVPSLTDAWFALLAFAHTMDWRYGNHCAIHSHLAHLRAQRHATLRSRGVGTDLRKSVATHCRYGKNDVEHLCTADRHRNFGIVALRNGDI